MKRIACPRAVFLIVFTAILSVAPAFAQETGIPFKYEELTAPDFVKAVELSGETCIIPIGVLEKHGTHLPLGTDMLDVREVASRAARMEYFVVFPEYYFGQILEARHQPGTIAYSQELQWKILEETGVCPSQSTTTRSGCLWVSPPLVQQRIVN